MEIQTPEIYSVSKLNKYVKGILDRDGVLSNFFLVGEISNYRPHYSGHMYMTLKDEASSVKAVMFAGNASRLKFTPENGMKVLVFGSASLFPRDGSYQVYINDMQPDGVGALNIAFEQLKKKLESEGLFDPRYKKELPVYPQRVGVVTSATGAAVQDIFNVLKRRYPVAEVVLRPCQVQGEGAALDIANAIKEFNDADGADVLIVGRGGGSIEDLWAFNEEIVARAVFNSRIPVISAVGHETDFTICDFVADLRAPTPSAAAECAVPDINELKNKIYVYRQSMYSSVRNYIDIQRAALFSIEKSGALKDPLLKLRDSRRDLAFLGEKLESYAVSEFDSKRSTVSALAGRLDALSPLKVISRGYGLIKKDDKVVSSVSDFNVGDSVSVKLSDGEITAVVNNISGD